MSEGNGARFEDTMEVLEAQREETEIRFRELLDNLTEHVGAVRAATERSTQLYQAHVAARRRALAAVKEGLADAAVPEAGELHWPLAQGFARRLLNNLVRWLMRDYLEVIDRRGDARSARIDELKLRVDRLYETVDVGGQASDAVQEALGAAHEALQAALATHGEMLDLVNAKDAEVLQRAVAGPLRRMEVLFDEFGRQQEAMLSQLVGRRHELDELVRAVAPVREEED